MKNGITKMLTVIAVTLVGTSAALAANNAVIIQAWLPGERGGLDWLPEDVDTADELWNDCFLVGEEFLKHVGNDSNRLHMLWAKGQDYGRQGWRYDPLGRLSIGKLTDDSATVATVENTFKTLGGSMSGSDSLFVYTWGHGAHNGRAYPTEATHFALTVRPIWYADGKWHYTPLWDTTFARMADTVHSNRVFIMQQCFGGGFMDDLADSTTTIVCAASALKESHSCDNKGGKKNSPTPEHEPYQGDTWRHVEFSFHFFNALRGGVAIAPYGNPAVYPSNPDTNHDSTVLWLEAFEFNRLYNS
ncbi:MAG: hypothetical protein ABIK86_02040 [candidate division WOR-3 bacterium]